MLARVHPPLIEQGSGRGRSPFDSQEGDSRAVNVNTYSFLNNDHRRVESVYKALNNQ
ncbi:hypothetical protein CANTEDRAFT_114642 [Yamadazyma tenuis ATCC 10573]|uniref:Uncharacterized protein n=1 Tax=Candida tenuis (strain ATCC 10573 / BCRC 21748 / CBS 615 / JCM 9827 / NBRC 10315 / NRRL Y-1498 / VKM Y-70) TaxID=590646 RepID=G3B602_CANTC|nr:uncharacterized protein CANTEDRAFT_114642 [Yamadazyma tenuis ATCC 10573]EGV63346.1 hypothetical protein CANTEDRAFT_114642 [Yamadazyma tenuis ATCC 10573]